MTTRTAPLSAARLARTALAAAGLLGLLLGATACSGAHANLTAQPSAPAWTANTHAAHADDDADPSADPTPDRATAAPKANTPAKRGYERLDDSVTFPNW